jgi:hypothetical protein
MLSTARTALLLGAVAVTGAACSFSVGTGPSSSPSSTSPTTSTPAAEAVIPKDTVEHNTADQIKAMHPDKPVAVSCPADLPKRNGAAEQCLLTSGSEQYPVTVTVGGVGTPAGGTVDVQIGHLLPNT